MFGSGVLEVAIGLCLLFLFVSLVCSAIRELIESRLKSRAMDLERGLRRLLDDPNGRGLVSALYNHSHVASLFGGQYDASKLTGSDASRRVPSGERQSLPTYIPAARFSAALMDLVMRGGGSSPYPAAPLTIEGLRAQAMVLPNDKVREAVLVAIDHADGDLAVARRNIEGWFNDTMERATGWYKRRTQYWLFAIGFVAAAFLNIDTLTIAGRLATDDALRQSIVKQAETVSAGPAPTEGGDVGKARAQLAAIGFPMGWRYEPLRCDSAKAEPKNGLRPLHCTPEGVLITDHRLWVFKDFKLGWFVADPQSCIEHGSGACKTARDLRAADWLAILVGWSITAFAVTFGAPFWFDVLNKFMLVRSTVRPAPSAEPPPAEAKTAPPPPKPAAGPLPSVPPVPNFTPEEWRPGFTNAGEVAV